MNSIAPRLNVIVAVLFAVAFVAGVYELFRLRFEEADAYPVYSTLRPDPLGARALYESLALQPGLTVSRTMRPLTLVKGPDTALFFLGVEEPFVPSPDFERIAGNGGRVVIAFLPVRPRLEAAVEIEQQLRGMVKQPAKPAKHVPTFFEQIGVTLVVDTVTRPPEGGWSSDPPRNTALWFDKLAAEWSVERRYRNHAVWIDRPWKAGSIVLVADSWMLSNEALAREPDAVALAKLVGPAHKVVFDEGHLGLEDSGSVAGLLRRYHLQGLVAVLLALAGLYVWKSSSPFPARPANRSAAAGLRGFSSASGLVSLLERSVRPPQLLEVCVREYTQTAGRVVVQRLADEPRKKLEETMRQGAQAADPVRGYEFIRKAIEHTVRGGVHFEGPNPDAGRGRCARLGEEETRQPWKQTSNN